MAGSFLSKLFTRSPALPPHVQQALGELARLAPIHPSRRGPIELLTTVLPRLYEEPVAELPPLLTREQALAKLAAGIPLLRGESWPLDVPALWRRWQQVCAALRQQGNEAALGLAEMRRSGRLQLHEWVQEVLAGRPESVHAQALDLGLDAGLAALVLRLVLFPVFCHLDAALASLREGLSWANGYCPTCGSWPLVGEFRGLEQTRFLRCGLCAAAWAFARLCCPFCQTRDAEMLGYVYVESEETRYRAATCKTCRGYVKMIATLEPLQGTQLLVGDVATMHLDWIAAEQGYFVSP